MYTSAAHYCTTLCSLRVSQTRPQGSKLDIFSLFRLSLLLGFAWDEPLLAAVVPESETGFSVLQVLRLSGAQDSGDDCLCSVVLEEESRQPAGNISVFFHEREHN